MMGLQFNHLGVYIGWSNLFDYTSLKTIEASELLPMPQKIEYSISNTGVDLLNLGSEYSKEEQDNVSYAVQAIYNSDNVISEETLLLQDPAYKDKKLEIEKEIEKASIIRLKAYATLLNFLQKYNITELVNSEGLDSKMEDIVQTLRSHEFTKIAPNDLESVAKNFISSHIQNTVQNLTNMIGAYSPIEMEFLRGATKYSAIVQNNRIKSLLNPATKYIMQNINKVGKDVIGIAATGIKGSFTWHYYLNELYQNPQKQGYQELIERSKFEFVTSQIVGRAQAMDDGTLYDTYDGTKSVRGLPDVNYSAVPDSVKAVVFGEASLADEATRAQVAQDFEAWINKNNITTDLMASQVLSAATDNAKELILQQINSGADMAKCYLYLITLGFDVRDIVAFMTSDVAMFVSKMTSSDIYNWSHLSINQAIKILEGELPSNWIRSHFTRNSRNLISKEHIETINSYFAEGKLDKEWEEKFLNDVFGKYPYATEKRAVTDLFRHLRRMRRLCPKDSDFKSKDLADFKKVLEGANEFSNFSRLLGINQGIKTKETDFNKYLKNISTIISDREKALKLVDSKGKKVNEDKVKELNLGSFSDIIGNFDVNRWLQDEQYQRQVAEYYGRIKVAIPIFDIINVVAQYNASFKLLDMTNTINSETTFRSQVMGKIYSNFNTQYIPDSYLANISKAVFAKAIEAYLEYRDFKLPIPKNITVLDSSFNEVKASVSDFQRLHSVTDRASFKYVFENYIVPNLKAGRIFTTDKDGNVIEETDKEKIKKVKSNKFIQGLVDGDDNNHSVIRLNMDMLNYEVTPEGKQKMEWYLNGIEELQHIYMGDLSIADWFMLYNLYTSHNQYGSNRLTTIFKNFIDRGLKSEVMDDFLTYIGNLDYYGKVEFKSGDTELNSIISITPTESDKFIPIDLSIQDLFMMAAPAVYSTRGRKEPICKVKTDNGIKLYYNNNGFYQELGDRYFTGSTEEEDQRKQYLINNFVTTGGIRDASILSLKEDLNSEDRDKIFAALSKLMQINFIVITQPIC